MYHDRTAWRCTFFVDKKYGCSKGYPQRNAAHMGMYHDRQRGVVRFFVGKKYGSKGYPQRKAAHMGAAIL
jgi:hypothetical protein